MRNYTQTAFRVWILVVFVVGCVGFAAEPLSSAHPLEITILYDNYRLRDDCRVDWGFSCMVTGLEKTILFDAGASGSILFGNMDKLQVDAHAIDLAIISHDHADHTGGLTAFLNRKGDIPVYLPRSVSSGVVQSAEGRGATVVIPEEPLALCEGAHLTGPMGGGIIEQSMILDTPKGLVVITGCAHPGIVQIVRKAKELFNREVYLVMGGFHLLNMTDAQVQQIIQQFRDLGVQKAGASHCTGPRAIELFRQAYRQDFVSIGVGKVDIPVDCDFTGDWLVDLDDLVMLIENWGQSDPRFDIAPTFGDGTVDASDLEVLMAFWKQEIRNPALMAHWKLDETAGDAAFDSVAENHAAILGDATWDPADGHIEGALSFDGIDDYIRTPRILNPADGVFSVFAWVKGGAPGKVIISQKDGADWLKIDGQGCLMTDLKSGGRRSGGPLVSEAIICDGNWHRIGFTWNGTDRILYVDDVEVARDTLAGLQESIGDLYIGAGNGLEAGTFWSGLIDDVRIYDRVVTL